MTVALGLESSKFKVRNFQMIIPHNKNNKKTGSEMAIMLPNKRLNGNYALQHSLVVVLLCVFVARIPRYLFLHTVLLLFGSWWRYPTATKQHQAKVERL